MNVLTDAHFYPPATYLSVMPYTLREKERETVNLNATLVYNRRVDFHI